MPALRALRAACRNLPLRAAAAADGADLSSPTISVRVRLSGAGEKPAGDLVLRNVDPHASTPRALVARWAAELGFSAERCTAVARADRAGAEEEPLHDLDVTLSAAGVADGGVVLVELAAGVKLITLRLSADKEHTVTLHGALGMANVLRRYNAVALLKVVDAASPSLVTEVFEFESLESGAAYAPVPRAPPPPPPAVRNVTLLRELLPPDANGSPHPPLVCRQLNSGALDRVLRDTGALGVSATRDLRELLFDVADLKDGATYYLAPREMAADELLKQQARSAVGNARQRASLLRVAWGTRLPAWRMQPLPSPAATHALAQVANLIGHNTNLATGLEHEAGECVRGIVSALHPGGDVVRVREKLYVTWEGKRLEIDEVVLANDGSCAYVVEAENVLAESSGDELQKRLDAIECVRHAPIPTPWRLYAGVADAHTAWATRLFVYRDFKDLKSCPLELRIFSGKQVHGVLCGRSVQLKQSPSRFASPEALVADWKARGYKLLLPSGAALASGDSLFSTTEFSC